MARYDQCDADCTYDCGHCKGKGRPANGTGYTVPQLIATKRWFDQAFAVLLRYEADCTSVTRDQLLDALSVVEACERTPHLIEKLRLLPLGDEVGR